MDCILEVNGLKKTFALSNKQRMINKTNDKYKVAVNNLSFKAYKGEIYGLLGPNGAGKTNILEALYFLSLGRSFRVNDHYDLIKKGKEQAEILAEIETGEITRKIHIILTKDTKQIFINNKLVTKTSDLAKTVNVLLFEPKDVLLFKGLPKNRRNFLDISIAKKSNPYLEYISKYNLLLKERNEILKQEKIDLNLLEINTEMILKISGPIISYRQMYIKDINDILIKITRVLTCACDRIEVIYKPFIPYNDNFYQVAKEAYKTNLESDIKHKATSIGVHRDDFQVKWNNKDIAEYGSQGENRIAAIALKLSPYFLIEDKDKRPIIALDDVMSELDQKHRQKLIDFLKKFEQVFITATNLEINGANQLRLKKEN